MINPILILLLINFIIVELVDRQNIPNQIANFITKHITNGNITNVVLGKPFNCSYCLTFWITLIYMLFLNPITIGWLICAVSIALGCAIYTRVTYYTLMVYDCVIELVFKWLHKWLTRL